MASSTAATQFFTDVHASLSPYISWLLEYRHITKHINGYMKLVDQIIEFADDKGWPNLTLVEERPSTVTHRLEVSKLNDHTHRTDQFVTVSYTLPELSVNSYSHYSYRFISHPQQPNENMKKYHLVVCKDVRTGLEYLYAERESFEFEYNILQKVQFCVSEQESWINICRETFVKDEGRTYATKLTADPYTEPISEAYAPHHHIILRRRRELAMAQAQAEAQEQAEPPVPSEPPTRPPEPSKPTSPPEPPVPSEPPTRPPEPPVSSKPASPPEPQKARRKRKPRRRRRQNTHHSS
jgi:hypothetical protein